MEQLQMNLYNACREDFILPDNCLDLGSTNVEVRRIQKKEPVNRFLNSFHYLHSGDSQKSIGVITRAYGMYIGGELAALAVYNPPGSSGIPKFLFGENNDSMRQGTLALSRLISHPNIPFNGTGYLISESKKLIWEDNIERKRNFKPYFKTVITFADTLLKHSGTVKRCQNAWYAGCSKGEGLGGFYNPITGDYINVRQGNRTLTQKDCLPGWKPFKASDKFRYLWFLDPKNTQLDTMRQLDEEIQFMCKVGEFSVMKQGRIVNLSDKRSYEEVYERMGRRGTDKAISRYSDYLANRDLKAV